MRLRIHHALFMGFVGTVGAVVILLAMLVGSRVRSELVDTFEDEIGRELNLTAALLRDVAPLLLDSAVSTVSRDMGHRVTVIDLDGVVLADSEVPAAELELIENHAGRPEVVGAV